MCELTAFREVLKEVYKHILTDVSKVEDDYSKIYRYGWIHQSKVYEDNEAYLNFDSLPKMTLRKKNTASPYHFCSSKVINLKIKVQHNNTNN